MIVLRTRSGRIGDRSNGAYSAIQSRRSWLLNRHQATATAMSSRSCRGHYRRYSDDTREGGMALDLFAGIPVANFAAALPWYERFFGGKPSFLPSGTEAVWEVAEHQHVYIVQAPGRAGNALVLSFVGDLDERVAAIARRGIESARRETHDSGATKVTYGTRTATRSASGAARADAAPVPSSAGHSGRRRNGIRSSTSLTLSQQRWRYPGAPGAAMGDQRLDVLGRRDLAGQRPAPVPFGQRVPGDFHLVFSAADAQCIFEARNRYRRPLLPR